ncbi:MAG: FAD-dependent oxidoreductase, partial [Xanthomonadales bacterium]|nr:FAD-dependent oxidoreductase [Xanthomonadales bacterium]
MSETVEVRVPDIGDFEKVPVIEVLVAEGDTVEKEQSLITLESDKATMEVPSPAAGVVESVAVKLNDEVSEGDLIATVKTEAGGTEEKEAAEDAEGADKETAKEEPAKEEPAEASVTSPRDAAPVAQDTQGGEDHDYEFDVVVLGSGPGGYTAAFRAADLGLKTALVERYPTLGGVCLNVGCIPSKALLHTAAIIDEAAAMEKHGVRFGEPDIDIDKLREFKDGVVGKLTGGLAGMAKKRKVEVIEGMGRLAGAHELAIQASDGDRTVTFANLIIAVGSRSIELPFIPHDDPRVLDSTSALELEDIPGRLLVIGGGLIGLEMACVYSALGSEVTVVELLPQLMTGADADLVRPLQKRIGDRYKAIYVETKVVQVEATDEGLVAHFEGEKAPEKETFDRVLVAVGRAPNGK